jgi:hypothetical protein
LNKNPRFGAETEAGAKFTIRIPRKGKPMPRFYTKPQTIAIPDPFSAHADVIARDPRVRAIRLALYARRNRASAFTIAAKAVRPPPPLTRRWRSMRLHRRGPVTVEDAPCR